ncbi:hypothetical protein FVER53590_28408 [Fusarium verticillioides]|nr:hypothetical protein FVER14953_21075 [Fusarium verticillioides]RBQ90296.1 hypothetical protein FVER53263_20366 [Fusarium verticillioides]RBR10156.1 hypothetical protein FVER53590_28408 [Fusarium verticillioides]
MLFREELVAFPGSSASHVLALVASAVSLAQVVVAFPGPSASLVLVAFLDSLVFSLVASHACPALAVVASPGSSVSLALALDSFLVLALALSLSDLVPLGAQSQRFLQRQACEQHPDLPILELLEPPPTFHFPVPGSSEILDPLEADHTRRKTSLHAS